VPRRRLLEDERWLAFVLLVPTMVLLGSSSPIRSCAASAVGDDSRVGVPGDFVGVANFEQDLERRIFRPRSTTPSSTRASRRSSSSGSGCGWRCCSTGISAARR
jgi:hypothetical protein